MRRRLYCLLPDIETTHRLVEKLLLARIKEDHIYVVARHDAQTQGLPAAGVAQTSDLAASAERGAAAGAVTGVLAGLAAMVFPPVGIAIGGGMIAATGVAGAGFGSWMSSMIGISRDSPLIEEYEQAIQNGKVLMMIDVEKEHLEDIERSIKDHYPDAEIEGTDPHKPVFP